MFMKFFALLFGFYIMFLALLPGINIITSSTGIEMQTCCAETCVPGEEDQPAKSNDQNEGCNPFQSCYCCIGFNIVLHTSPNLHTVVFSTSQTESKEKVPPHFTLDFWQPPKLV